MNTLNQDKIIPFPGSRSIYTKKSLRNQCHFFCGYLEDVADQCYRGEADETDIVKTLEEATREAREGRWSKIRLKSGRCVRSSTPWNKK